MKKLKIENVDVFALKVVGVLFLILIGIFALTYYFSSIFIVFVSGLILIMISEKIRVVYDFLLQKTKISHKKKKVLGYSISILSILFLVFVLSVSVLDIIEKFQDPKFQGDLIGGIYETSIKPHVSASFESYVFNAENIKSFQNKILSFVSSWVSDIGSFVFNSVLIIPLMFAIYNNKKNSFKKTINNYIPRVFSKLIMKILNDTTQELKYYLNAKGLESLIIFIICAIGFSFIGLDGWFFLAILAGFLNIIPYLGPLIGAILPIFVALTYGMTTVLWTVGVVVMAQLIDNLYLIPFMVSNKVKMEPLLSIVLILVGAKIFGIFGMVFIIPVYLIGNTVLTKTYKQIKEIDIE